MTDDVSPDIIKSTQKTLGKYIKRPPLTDKLLKRPPFRFLHDIVTAVVKETGFLKGLFTDVELQSENVKDREAKVAFLNKLIDAIKTIAQVEIQAKPSKIISGLEATETNILLQALGAALDAKLDSSAYVAQVRGVKEQPKAKTRSKNETDREKERRASKNETDRDKKKVPNKNEIQEKAKIRRQESEQSTDRKERNKAIKKGTSPRTSVTKTNKHEAKVTSEKTKKESNRDNDKIKKATKVSPRKQLITSENLVDKVEEPIPENNNLPLNNDDIISENIRSNNNDQNDQPDETLQTDKTIEQIPDDTKNEVVASMHEEVAEAVPSEIHIPMERPKSARPRSSDIKRERPSSSKPKVNDVQKDLKTESPLVRPKSSLRPPSVRPSSARPGAPRLRPDSALPMKEMVPLGKINVIVENFSNQDDEEETVVIQSANEVEPDPPVSVIDIPVDKGHLVEQILEQISDTDMIDNTKVKVEIDWEQEGFRGKDSMSKDINAMRNSIQTLTRTANPLGKLMNFLHEDLEAMQIELDTWTATKRQIKDEIANQKRVNEEVTKPLKNKLLELEESIKRQEEEIFALKAEILRNDTRIKELLLDQM